MWKFKVSEIGDLHYRQLRTLVKLGMTDAHIVVGATKIKWPQTMDPTDRGAKAVPQGEAIN
jgi:hypothetical protein